MTSAQRPRVAAYGYFGMGNIGNEGTLSAFLDQLRPDHRLRLSCFAAGPEAVRRDHGIPAKQLMSFRADPRQAGVRTKVRKAAGRLQDVPRTFSMMRDVDVLVVPGTGAMETSLVARPFGHPYWLFLATLSCRLRRRDVALVSIGAEYARHPLIRRFYRWTGALASYCSFRDEESQRAARAMGIREKDGGIFPDLAFALPTPDGRAPRPGHTVVGILPYEGAPHGRSPRPSVLPTYTADITELVARLLDGGRTVTLVIGDVADEEFALHIESLVRSARPDLAPDQVTVSRARTLDGIMREMADAEVVLGSRFHHVVCALKLAKPTISLGYGVKNANLMARFGLGDFAHVIGSFDVETVLEQVTEVVRVQAAVETEMKATLQLFDNELEAQFQQLSARFFSPRPTA